MNGFPLARDARHNEFDWQTDNYGTTYSDAGLGTSIPANALAHTKGAGTSVIAGNSVTEDVYGISIMGIGGAASVTSQRFLADLLTDPAGGTSWSLAIENLLFHGPSIQIGGYRYYFPLFLKAGTSIGFQQQSSETVTVPMRVAIRLYGKPTRPELLKTGQTVETYGAVTASTEGTTITPGVAVLGAWASIGTTTGEPWWWQAGMAATDISLNAQINLQDVAIGDATNKRMCIENLTNTNNTNEQCSKGEIGMRWPTRQAVAGETVYTRGTGRTTADIGVTACVYGMY